jgi:nitroreductase
MMSEKKALTDYPIHGCFAERWSPYAFENHPASEADLCLSFEAAHRAASNDNEQPWSYIVSAKRNPELF